MSEENYMRIIDLRGKKLTRAEMLEAMPRAEMGTNEATELVQPILDDVKARGAAALRDFAEKFDHIRPEHLRVPVEAMKAAVDELDPEVRAAIEESVRRCRAVSASQVPAPFHTDLAEGARVAERWIPVQRVGLYVPGGKAVYPSSVIMNVVPAQAAGVESLAIATPPSRSNSDGLPDKTILATCAILGVDEVYAVGGAQAIAMFAYGAKGSEPQDGEILCDPVDKITGPGNIFVATAKRMVSGIVGIDAVAGPTEIAIIADKGANPSWLAADLIGQAEHDELAGSVLITDSEDIADKVQESLKYRVPRTEHAERVHTSLSGTQSAIVLTDGLDQSIDAANAYAADGARVLLVAHLPADRMEPTMRADGAEQPSLADEPRLLPEARPVALVICSERIRADAEQTLAWFRDQGVRCRVISGDNPATVGAIATKVRLTGGRRPVAKAARELAADALEQLGYQAESAPWRNFYLSGARDLRAFIDVAGTQVTFTVIAQDGKELAATATIAANGCTVDAWKMTTSQELPEQALLSTN